MNPITLIIPPSVFLLDERVFVSLGILRVAAALEARGHAVELLDLSGVANYADAVRDHAGATSSRFFGVTATTPQLPAATLISRAIRDVRPDAITILGGPHATLTLAARKHGSPRAERALACLHAEFDRLVAGDGEDAVMLALRDDAPSVIDADDPKSPLFLTSKRLTELPLPARHLVDLDSYHYEIEDRRATTIIAQLGCPFNCGFCAGRDSPFLRRVRTRTTESILAELAHLHERYGFRAFNFFDDELNVNKSLVSLMREIARVQKDLGAEWRLRGFVKSELFNDEQAEAMFSAGFRWILVGFESGSDRILRNINKRATKEENTRCVEIARRHGLKVKALMSVGHPGESRETIDDTRAWLLDVRPDAFDVTIITPYPGSPYFDRAELQADGSWCYTFNGDRLYQREIDYSTTADYYKGAPGEYTAHVWTDHVTADELVTLRDSVERDVRRELGIPYDTAAPAIAYEHSMGQSALLRRTA